MLICTNDGTINTTQKEFQKFVNIFNEALKEIKLELNMKKSAQTIHN